MNYRYTISAACNEWLGELTDTAQDLRDQILRCDGAPQEWVKEIVLAASKVGLAKSPAESGGAACALITLVMDMASRRETVEPANARSTRKPQPQAVLFEGDVMPDKPVYWVVEYYDRSTGQRVSSRMTHGKVKTPIEALHSCYGECEPTPAFRFHVLGTAMTGARKIIRQRGL